MEATDTPASQAREGAKAQASAPQGPGAWKWQYRKQMWDYMEAEDIARLVYGCALCTSSFKL